MRRETEIRGEAGGPACEAPAPHSTVPVPRPVLPTSPRPHRVVQARPGPIWREKGDDRDHAGASRAPKNNPVPYRASPCVEPPPREALAQAIVRASCPSPQDSTSTKIKHLYNPTSSRCSRLPIKNRGDSRSA